MDKGVTTGPYNAVRLFHIALDDLQIEMDKCVKTIKQIDMVVSDKGQASSVILEDHVFLR